MGDNYYQRNKSMINSSKTSYSFKQPMIVDPKQSEMIIFRFMLETFARKYNRCSLEELKEKQKQSYRKLENHYSNVIFVALNKAVEILIKDSKNKSYKKQL
ncbi:MAG: hypothetical protein FK731_09495 [Asgard group archaeon]|nr:hypothetical protein [Asgard group archaeon]